MISIQQSCDNLELHSIHSNSLPSRNTQASILSDSEMSVESHSVAALHGERVLVEDEVSFLIPSTGQCLTCMASGLLIGAKLFLNLPT